eukprot:TRINITY_DN2256_c0_g2_i1.p2 TRINITY_DN2256_c0_g2~~TRINITY_DN2256_c0_g2_i1.p2  ORF type:complete len:289 (-),score=100.16 TRINITY_DN2256_c0_g2_i1:125-991(-)
MELFDLEQGVKAVACGGHVLNCQEVTCIQAGLNAVKCADKFNEIYFWGKIFGQTGDYYLAYGLKDDEFEFPAKVFYYANGESYEFKPLPQLTQDIANKLEALGTEAPFTGNPSKIEEPPVEGEEEAPPAEEGEEGEAGQSDKPKKLMEADRLAYVVAEIDFETSVVPKGAHSLSEAHTVVSSNSFKGLGLTEAEQLKNYVHFRQPTSIASQRALARSDVQFYSDFLDPIEADLPKGCWVARRDHSVALVTLRSLSWPGYTAYHIPDTKKFGGLYFGYGQKNRDLPFLL